MSSATLTAVAVGKTPDTDGDQPHDVRSERDVENARRGLGPVEAVPSRLVGNTPPEAVQLRNLAREIKQHHESFEKGLRTSLSHAREAGDKLLEAKKLLGHGNFSDWVEKNCAVSLRTAQKHMRIAQRWSELDAKAPGTAHLTIDAVLERLGNSTSGETEGGEPESASKSTTNRGDGALRNALSKAVEKKVDAQVGTVFEEVIRCIKQAADDLCRAAAGQDGADPILVARRLTKAVRERLVPTRVFGPGGPKRNGKAHSGNRSNGRHPVSNGRR
jgi:hypothetical protein